MALPDARKYLIFGIMAFGQFMALIDIQIVAASLNDVQAGLSAGPDEISWIQTGYLMAELVMIPFSAFLAQALSTRWLFALSAGLFTLASALCGAGLGHPVDDRCSGSSRASSAGPWCPRSSPPAFPCSRASSGR